jgi:2',3'-cyclic-nucleotide 2'-phosphodiesterase (5'-nucleotidase family)
MHRTFKRGLLITAILGLILACNPAYKMVSGDYRNQEISPESLSKDSVIVSIIAPYKEKLDAEMNHVIGFAHTDLFKGKPESGLTNLLADLILEESIRIVRGHNIIPDLAFLNYGGIRTGIPQGEFTVRKIFEIMPFENELVVIRLSGGAVQQFLDLIASRGGDSLSGVRFRIRNDKAVDVTIGGKPLDTEKTYWLATSDYVADGGDSYAMLQNSIQRINTDERIRDVMIRYFDRSYAEGKIINPETDGRIINE